MVTPSDLLTFRHAAGPRSPRVRGRRNRLGGALSPRHDRPENLLHRRISGDESKRDIGYGTHVTAWLVQLAEWLRRAGVYDAYR